MRDRGIKKKKQEDGWTDGRWGESTCLTSVVYIYIQSVRSSSLSSWNEFGSPTYTICDHRCYACLLDAGEREFLCVGIYSGIRSDDSRPLYTYIGVSIYYNILYMPGVLEQFHCEIHCRMASQWVRHSKERWYNIYLFIFIYFFAHFIRDGQKWARYAQPPIA